MDRAELQRHRGHAHRFSLDLEEALDEYLRALDLARHVPSMRGKLRTNVAETRCWLDPGQGVHDAEEAVEVNERLGSHIEVAKAQAALGLALSGTGYVQAAREACERALDEAEHTGYRAGACFAHQARVVTEVRAGDRDAAARAYDSLVEVVGELSTYGHLCVLPAWFRGDDAQVRRWSRDVEWIGDVAIETRLRSLLDR